MERDNAGVVAPPPLIYAVPLAAGLLLDRVHHVPVLPAPIARVLGWSLVLLGTGGTAWFAATMRSAETPLDPRSPTRTLVTSGPFRYSRNPGYSSFTLIYLGVALIRNALWPLLLLPAATVVMQRGVIEREERYLQRKFGAEYTQYKAATPRWL